MNASQNNVTMESITLTELHVIEDESEYVFIKEGETNDGLFDDEDYDHCDLSPDLSCATSVATEVTLKDLNLSLIDEGVESTTVSLGDEERDDDNSKHHFIMDSMEGGGGGGGDETETEKRARENSFDKSMTSSSSSNSKSRISNKKRRKKLKMMKKAAAAAAALSAVNEQNGVIRVTSSTHSPARSTRAVNSSSSSRKSRARNVAVACVHESLAAYREEVQGLVTST